MEWGAAVAVVVVVVVVAKEGDPRTCENDGSCCCCCCSTVVVIVAWAIDTKEFNDVQSPSQHMIAHVVVDIRRDECDGGGVELRSRRQDGMLAEHTTFHQELLRY